MAPDLTITFFPRRPGNLIPVRLAAKVGETVADARRLAFRSATRMHDDTELVEIISDDGMTVRELWEDRNGDGNWTWAGHA